MRVVYALLMMVGMSFGLAACEGDDTDVDAGRSSDASAMSDIDSGSTGDDAGSAEDAGEDPTEDAGPPDSGVTFVTESVDCADLPGAFEGTGLGDAYREVCIDIDWATNPCVVHLSDDCTSSIFFEWEREEGGYFNVKFYDGAEPESSSAGTVLEDDPYSTAPGSVVGLPEGEDVLVRVTDANGNKYDINFRRDGDVLTIDYIIKRV